MSVCSQRLSTSVNNSASLSPRYVLCRQNGRGGDQGVLALRQGHRGHGHRPVARHSKQVAGLGGLETMSRSTATSSCGHMRTSGASSTREGPAEALARARGVVVSDGRDKGVCPEGWAELSRWGPGIRGCAIDTP